LQVSSQWLEFPDAVRFAPTDLELLGYLEEKIVHGNSASHIDEFIPTIEERKESHRPIQGISLVVFWTC
jgi:hypothetical protein